MLPNNDAVRTVGLGKDGLAEAVAGTKVWIDFSSIDKETIVSVVGEFHKKGCSRSRDASALAAGRSRPCSASATDLLFREPNPLHRPSPC
jgi:hypothetical protein